jgi:hypothetical protein
VILDENSTRAEYIMKFLDKVRVGKLIEATVTCKTSLGAKIIRADGSIEDLGELGRE